MNKNSYLSEYFQIFRSSKVLKYCLFLPILAVLLLCLIISALKFFGLPFMAQNVLKLGPFIIIPFMMALFACHFSIKNYLSAKSSAQSFTGSFEDFRLENIKTQWSNGYPRIILLPLTSRQILSLIVMIFALGFITSHFGSFV